MPANTSARKEDEVSGSQWRFADCELEEISRQLRVLRRRR